MEPTIQLGQARASVRLTSYSLATYSCHIKCLGGEWGDAQCVTGPLVCISYSEADNVLQVEEIQVFIRVRQPVAELGCDFRAGALSHAGGLRHHRAGPLD